MHAVRRGAAAAPPARRSVLFSFCIGRVHIEECVIEVCVQCVIYKTPKN